MRLAHKRKVQAKLQKRIKAIVANLATVKATVKSSTSVQQPAQSVHSKALSAHQSEQAATPTVTCQLTPKQQQVLEIVRGAVEGINPKAIGLQAGQEEAKASAWAAGALKNCSMKSWLKKTKSAIK